ncbi:sulfite:cytochrome c oxidoreductase subunit B [Methylocaldum marinum]|uniref:Sulfite:cytochrome c oxidoreductase subunit B n=1 Tax=Methylocaldum marinum TaxID=1432792 RepID=A0A286P356_9GAMM|nr:cytochrome c [Methylocaldum marinum]BBA32078.1 sulfite:cytochrome c oxidoreductase subunit B [Methylocaldum marinum]
MSVHVMNRFSAVTVVAVLYATAACGAEPNELEPGAGRDSVMANCVMCHSVDYIAMHASFMKRADWRKTVDKMVSVMGAPIDQDDIPVIVDYLTKHYSVE